MLASNSGFDDLLPPELRFAREDAAGLAERLRELAGTDRNALGRELRAAVEARHSTGHWADRLLEVAERRQLRKSWRKLTSIGIARSNSGDCETDGEWRFQLPDENGDRQQRRFAT